MFDLLFLGTGASVPSKTRALPAVAVRRGPDIVLFDCGEGTQRQFMLSRFSFMKVRAIFITHLHGDHFYGLPGLLQTMGLSGRKDPLLVCGPQGFSNALSSCLDVCEGEIEYPLDVRDVNPGDRVSVRDLTVEVFATEHGIRSQGYVLREPAQTWRIDARKARDLGIEGSGFRILKEGGTVNGHTLEDVGLPDVPGRSVAYTGDTRGCRSIAEAVRGVDALVHESTYLSADRNLATEHNHSTAKDAALVARDAGVGTLFLVHVSNRYKDHSAVCGEARGIFPDTIVPDDLELYTMTGSGFRSV